MADRVARAREPEKPVQPPAIIDDERLITITEVCAMTAMHRATVYRKMAAAEFPAGRDTGDNSVRWVLGEVRAWIRALPLRTGKQSLRRRRAVKQ